MFSEELKKWRRKKKFSQTELARLINVNNSYISRLENKNGHKVRPELVHKVAQALKLTEVERMEFEFELGLVPNEIRNLLKDQETKKLIIKIFTELIKIEKKSNENKKKILEYFKGALPIAAAALKKLEGKKVVKESKWGEGDE